MPALSIELVFGYGSDRGSRRAANEDSLVADTPLFAVADGMGGHEAGEVASGICVQVLGEHFTDADADRPATREKLAAAIAQADLMIREVGESRAGTTLSGTVLTESAGRPHWLIFNVGDSRTYRLSRNALAQLSVDHSAVQELVDSGQLSARQARMHPRRNVVTRALGTGPRVEADMWLVPAADGDRILVCSDGLTSEIEDAQIQRILSSLQQPQEAAEALIQAALRAGGRDNITVIVVDAAAPAPEPNAPAPDDGEKSSAEELSQ